MDLDAVLSGVVIVPDFDPALKCKARVFREVRIAADEIGNRTPPGAAKSVLAKGQSRFEEYRAFRIVIKRVDYIAGGSTNIAAFCIDGADMHQAVAPSLLRGIDHLFADRGHFDRPCI